MKDALDAIGYIFTIRELIMLFVSFGVVTVSIVTFVLFVYRKERRLFKNVKKSIVFLNLTTDSEAMKLESEIIKKGKFFKVPEIMGDSRIIDTLDISTYSLIVLGINESTEAEHFKKTYQNITGCKKPVIIYTLGNRNVPFLHSESYIKDYYQHTIATTPIRLVGDIFTVLSTFITD